MPDDKAFKSQKKDSDLDLVALKERIAKHEAELRELKALELRKEEHKEPGIHEAEKVGVASHTEPGNHENVAMDMPQSPPVDTVGSGNPTPSGQLYDNCPLCGNLDLPGHCTCLMGKMEKPSKKAAKSDGAVSEVPMNLSEKANKIDKMCKMCKKECRGACLNKATDVVDMADNKFSVGVVGELPGDKPMKVIPSPGSGDPIKKDKKPKAKLDKNDIAMAKPPSGKAPDAPAAPPVNKTIMNQVPGAPVAPPMFRSFDDILSTLSSKKDLVSHLLGKSENWLGNCVFCNKPEHADDCK